MNKPTPEKKEVEIFNPEKEDTNWNKEQDDKDKLPIDKLIDIADEKGLFPKEQTREQKWDTFIRGIRLSDILKDCLQSSMNEFASKYNAKNPKENVQFKMFIRKVKPNYNKKVKEIFACKLVLEMRRLDSHKIVQEKVVTFSHVAELKDETAWRYSLYAAMFQELINLALTLTIVNDDTLREQLKGK